MSAVCYLLAAEWYYRKQEGSGACGAQVQAAAGASPLGASGSARRAGWFRGSYICCLRQRPMSESEHNPSTQPAAAGGHNLQPRRGWPPSPLNLLNPLNPLNPGRARRPIQKNPRNRRGSGDFFISSSRGCTRRSFSWISGSGCFRQCQPGVFPYPWGGWPPDGCSWIRGCS